MQLLSASAVSNIVAAPLLTSSLSGGTPAASSGQATPSVTNATPLGHTPAQIAEAYGFNQVAFSNGVKGDGAGQTIAIVDAYVDPNIASDLQKFDTQFGLAAPPSLTQAVEQGATTNSGWALETALDVEWAHAMAPNANIVLVEANNSSLSSLLSAVNYARNLANVSVVSMSWGAGEFASETGVRQLFHDARRPYRHHLRRLFRRRRSGNDLALGLAERARRRRHDALDESRAEAYAGEAAWSGSGGGVSTFETEPSYQTSVQSTGQRTTPDVAYDANPNTGFAVYDSVPYAGQNGWFEVGGTSAGAPQWAAPDRHCRPGTRDLRSRFALECPVHSLHVACQRFPRHHFRLERQRDHSRLRSGHRARLTCSHLHRAGPQRRKHLDHVDGFRYGDYDHAFPGFKAQSHGAVEAAVDTLESTG